ncbi:MAG TPA: biosynthetic peptidoglycan transglycosylase [Caldimonas sp.]
MKAILRKLAVLSIAALLVAALAATLLVVTLPASLRAAPGEWSERVALGPVQLDVSVLGVIRVASHPLGLRALAGRSWKTPIGTLHFSADPERDSLTVICAPCAVRAPALSREPLQVVRAELTLRRAGPNELYGDLVAGSVRTAWLARLHPRDLDLELTLADAPLADAYALFGAAFPEAARARIEARAGAEIRLTLPSRHLVVKPHLEGFAVSGLGTEALLVATPLPACARPTRKVDAAAPFGPWLPKAVVAAEDQRFFDHRGYDLDEMTAAWANDRKSGKAPRGASTLSQQLAKLLYTGEERTLARKLRELLYAVELDRTLGKQRVLTLYLAVAPWGEARCGAQAAALDFFGKRASALGPIEAAWLASLLRNPDAELRRTVERGAPDRPRLGAILAGLHPLSHARREALVDDLRTWEAPASGH